VARDGGDRERHADAEGGHAPEEADQELDPAEELSHAGQEAEDPGDVHGAGEEAHGSLEPVAAEGAEQLLHPVRPDDEAEREAGEQGPDVVGRGDQSA
jgi:hypothetical protein